MSFVFSVSSEETSDAKLGESHGGFSDERMQDNGAGAGKTEEKYNTDNDEDRFEPGAGPEGLNIEEELDKSKEESPKDDTSDEDQIRSTSSQSDSRVDSEESHTDHPPFALQEDMNESYSESEHQKSKVHTDQSGSAEPSASHHLPGQLTALRLALASSLIHGEKSSAGANSKGIDLRSDISSEEGQTVPSKSEPMLGPFQTASALTSSSEEETDNAYKNSVTDPTLRKTASLSSGPESTVNTEEVKKNEVSPTLFSSGSDFYPDYVNDDWQYDPRYYDPYRNHPGYAAGYDPYGAGYDPYAAGYDPYQGGYDPYAAGYDPYQRGYDPYGEAYDPYRAGYDPYGAGYDPYQAGYDNQDPYHETKGEDPRHDVEHETTPAYFVEEHESHPTEIPNSQDNSHSEEQPWSLSISPSSTPVSLPEGSDNMDFAHNMPSEEPSNSSSIETSRERELQPSKGPNGSNSPPDSAVSNSEEGTETRADAVSKNMAARGSSSSEESIETADSEQDTQNPMDQPGNQGTPDPAIPTSHMSVVQVRHNTHEVPNEEEPPSQSLVDLIHAFSSEEDDPLANTIERIMALAVNGGSNEESTVVGKNPDSAPSDNTHSENNQNEESNESTTDNPGISAEVTRESVHLSAESPAFDSEPVPTSDSLASNGDASSENPTPNPSTNVHFTTQSSDGLDNSAEANTNTANDSEESQESQIFIPSTVLPIANQPSHVQNPEISSDEENTRDRKSTQGIIRQPPVESPAKIIVTNLWTSFLQALNVPIANQSRQSVQKNVRRPQRTRSYHQRSNRRQKANSSEERK